MVKVSPIAEYLTANKAVVKKDGNVCHFLSRQGCYLGKQVTMKNGPTTMFLRIIYGEGVKPVYIENIVSNQGVVYTSDRKNVGIKILPYHSMIFRQLVDFFAGTQYFSTKETKLTNPLTQIGVIENIGVKVFDKVNNPKYTSKLYDIQETPLTQKEIPFKILAN